MIFSIFTFIVTLIFKIFAKLLPVIIHELWRLLILIAQAIYSGYTSPAFQAKKAAGEEKIKLFATEIVPGIKQIVHWYYSDLDLKEKIALLVTPIVLMVLTLLFIYR